MLKTSMRCALAAMLIAVCLGTGCRKPKEPPLSTRVLTKVEFFQQTQAHTMTPHGTIDLPSVAETPEGVEYRTADGRRWQVVLERTPTGWRIRGDPREMK